MEATPQNLQSQPPLNPQPRKTRRISKLLKANNPVPIQTKPRYYESPIGSSPSISVSQQIDIDGKTERLERFYQFFNQLIQQYNTKPTETILPENLRIVLEEPFTPLPNIVNYQNDTDSPNFMDQIMQHWNEIQRYWQVVRQCGGGAQILLLKNQEKNFLTVFKQKQLIKMLELSDQEVFMVKNRAKFLWVLDQKQNCHILKHGTTSKLSELAAEICFLLYLMRIYKSQMSASIFKILSNLTKQQYQWESKMPYVMDEYVSCLIQKNLCKGLANTEVDYFNYYLNLDKLYEEKASGPWSVRQIQNAQQFQKYIRRKKNKKIRKNYGGVLKTACGGCLSDHSELFNPLLHCHECQIRFHKYCYDPPEVETQKEIICWSCYNKRNRKTTKIQCQLCSVHGFLTLPLKGDKQEISVHIFCMLINGLWKYEKGELEFCPNSRYKAQSSSQNCSICESSVYTYACRNCQTRAHPLCAFMNGWSMELGENGVQLQCSCNGANTQQVSYRRKFLLNYKKMLFKGKKSL